MARYTYKHFNYRCPKCDFVCSILKDTSLSDRDENCEKCGKKLSSENRLIQNNRKASNYSIIGAKVENAEFNYGLGAVTKNKYHRSELAKRKNCVEVGNDFVSGEKMQKSFEKKKSEELENKWEKEPNGGYII